MLQRIRYALAGLCLAALLPACTTVNEAVDAVKNATATSTSSGGTSGGTSAGTGGYGMSMHQFSMQLFRSMFYQGGYNMEGRGFEPGEYVQWDVTGQGGNEWYRKALLKRRGDGSEWWRLTAQTSDSKIVMEALLEPADEAGNRRIVRLRQKLGADQEPREIPITQENARKWTLSRQRRLTEESYQGLKVGTTEVTVPAGTFRVEHLRTTHAQRGGTVDWYLSDRVPGGLVKYRWSSGGDERTLALSDYGEGRTTSKLGAF